MLDINKINGYTNEINTIKDIDEQSYFNEQNIILRINNYHNEILKSIIIGDKKLCKKEVNALEEFLEAIKNLRDQ